MWKMHNKEGRLHNRAVNVNMVYGINMENVAENMENNPILSVFK
jgi:hypothetical protein